jgi:lipopolysaccharide export system ATP-binding protein
VLDLLAWFRRKGGAPRGVSGGGQRGIAQPASGPMFTERVAPMSQQRGQPQNRADPRARHDAYEESRRQPQQESYQEPYDDPRYASDQDPRQNTHQDTHHDARYDPQPDQAWHDQPAPQEAQAARRPAQAQSQSQDDGAAWNASTQGYLAAHGVERSFVGRKVVKGVSLYVRRGEAVGLLGPNGAGKTTVFYMITGLITADKGHIELDGHDVTSLPMYQRARLGIGYLPQEASIFRGLNVEQNIRAVLEIVEPSRKRREYDLDALLEEFNITRLRKTPTIALSGGERRRVEIARALATRPNYMLLDEPFAGIDPIAVGDIQALVRHLTQRGIGVLITDHNVRETLGLTDRAYIIYSGEVLMEGRADDIVNNPDVRRLYLGEEFRM